MITYFGTYGTTEKFAKDIAELTGGDLFEIEPVVPYDKNTAHYEELAAYAKKERDGDTRPEIKTLPDVSKYDYIFIGYPIWWGEAPHIIYNLVESVSLKKKTVIPFCTSMSSGLGNSAGNLKQNAKISRKTKWLKGKNFFDIPTQKKVNQWIDSLKY